MNLQMSYKNSGVFWHMVRNALTRSKALIVTYSVVSLIFYPFMFLLNVVLGNGGSYNYSYQSLTLPTVLVYYPMVAIMPVVIAAVIWNYLFSKPAVDVFHSMPIKKCKLFLANYSAGLMIYSIPIILCFVLVIIIYLVWSSFGIVPTQYAYETISQAEMVKLLLKQMAAVLYTGIGLYSLACFVTVNTGTAFDFVLYTIGISATAPMLIYISHVFGDTFLYGYFSDYGYTNLMAKIFPTAYMILALGDTDNLNILGWGFGYLAVSALLVAAGILLYNRRKSEHAGKTYTGSFVSHIVKGILSFILGAFLGLSFYVVDESAPLFYFGLILGSAISYFVIEIIISRGLKTLSKRILPCSVVIMLLIIFSSSYVFDIYNFEKYVPNTKNIASVSFNYHADGSDVYEIEFTEPEAIEAIANLHKQSIERKNRNLFDEIAKENESEYDNYYYAKYNNIFSPKIIYTLKDGTTVTRNYSQKFYYDELLDLVVLLDTESYKKANNAYSSINCNQIKSAYIYDKIGSNATSLNYNSQQLCELLRAMSKDMEEMTFEERYTPENPQVATLSLEISYKEDYSLSPSTKGYSFIVYEGSETHKLLQEYTKNEAYSINYEDISYISLVRTNSENIGYNESVLVYNSSYYGEYAPDVVIEDPELIRQAMDIGYLYYAKEYITAEENGYLFKIGYGKSNVYYSEEKAAAEKKAADLGYSEAAVESEGGYCYFIPYDKMPKSIKALF